MSAASYRRYGNSSNVLLLNSAIPDRKVASHHSKINYNSSSLFNKNRSPKNEIFVPSSKQSTAIVLQEDCGMSFVTSMDSVSHQINLLLGAFSVD